MGYSVAIPGRYRLPLASPPANARAFASTGSWLLQPANQAGAAGECPLPSGESPFNRKLQPLENANETQPHRDQTQVAENPRAGLGLRSQPTTQKNATPSTQSHTFLAIKLWFWRKLSTVIYIESDDRDSFLQSHNHTRIAKLSLRAPQEQVMGRR